MLHHTSNKERKITSHIHMGKSCIFHWKILHHTLSTYIIKSYIAHLQKNITSYLPLLHRKAYIIHCRVLNCPYVLENIIFHIEYLHWKILHCTSKIYMGKSDIAHLNWKISHLSLYIYIGKSLLIYYMDEKSDYKVAYTVI